MRTAYHTDTLVSLGATVLGARIRASGGVVVVVVVVGGSAHARF